MNNFELYKINCSGRDFSFKISNSAEFKNELLILTLAQETIKKYEKHKEGIKLEEILLLSIVELSSLLIKLQSANLAVALENTIVDSSYKDNCTNKELEQLKEEIIIMSSFLKEILISLN